MIGEVIVRKTLLNSTAAIAIFCMIGTPSNAADLEQVSYEQIGYDWSGLYIGGHIGYGAANFGGVAFNTGRTCTTCSEVFASQLDLSGITGGVHGGFNWQIDSTHEGHDIVFGIEGDITFTHWEDWTTNRPSSRWTDFGDTDSISGDVDLLASVRARLGVAFDRTLVFGTAGLAYNNADYCQADSDDFTGCPFELDHFGGVVGGGIEHAVTDEISFKVQGLYYLFDNSVNTEIASSANTGDFVSFDNAFDVNVGLSYKF